MMNLFDETPLILDGAMGTMLQQAGLPVGASPDAWNMEHPEVVERIHTAYLEAGAQMILSNTFGSNAPRQKRGKYAPGDLAAAGVRIAKSAAQKASKTCFVALDIGPLGVLLEPMGDMTAEEATTLFAEPIAGGAAEQPDCILIETMCDVTEACAAVEAAKKFGRGLPVFCTLSFDERGRLMTGADIPTVVAKLTAAGVDGLGCNCGLGPDLLLKLLPQFTACTKLPLLMSPNAGLPVFRNGETCYDVLPEAFAEDMKQLYQGGVWALGGCCGTTPAHIKAMVTACKKD